MVPKQWKRNKHLSELAGDLNFYIFLLDFFPSYVDLFGILIGHHIFSKPSLRIEKSKCLIRCHWLSKECIAGFEAAGRICRAVIAPEFWISWWWCCWCCCCFCFCCCFCYRCSFCCFLFFLQFLFLLLSPVFCCSFRCFVRFGNTHVISKKTYILYFEWSPPWHIMVRIT